MILAVDIYYPTETDYTAAGVLFEDFSSREEIETIKITRKGILKPYIPGKFKERELPCILRLLKEIDLERLDTIIIDGYANLVDEHGLPLETLGKTLHTYLKTEGWNICIIGVAKTKFKDSAMSNCKAIYRGKEAQTPLYISSIGDNISNSEIAEKIKNMYGLYRLPNMIRLADRISKGKE